MSSIYTGKHLLIFVFVNCKILPIGNTIQRIVNMCRFRTTDDDKYKNLEIESEESV